jgi:flagellar export protein FliJ
MAYQSRLLGVLFQRGYQEEEAMRIFEEARVQLGLEQDRLMGLNQTRQARLSDLTEKQRQSANAEELSLYFRFIERLRGSIIKQTETVRSAEAVCEEKRALLERAIREKKVVERIDEKRKKEYWKIVSKKEQAVLDEVGGQLVLRQHHV